MTLKGTIIPSDVYSMYLEITPNKYKVSVKLYSLIIRKFMYYLVSDIISKGVYFKLPYNLGTFKMVKKHRQIVLTDDGDIDLDKSILIRKPMGDRLENHSIKTLDMFNVAKEVSINYICRLGRLKNRNLFFLKPSYNLWKILKQ